MNDEAAQVHGRCLQAYIADEIMATPDRRIGFARYMELALHAPGLGYYSAGSAKIGPAGDFTTAAEISEAYTRCIARHCAVVLAETCGSVLEVGAGSGAMAMTLLEELAHLDCLPERYEILESSADLRQRQQERLAGLPARLRQRIVWRETLPSRPFRGVILANELLDAMPVHRLRLQSDGWYELCAVLDHGRIEAGERPLADRRLLSALEQLLASTGPLPEGYVVEIGLAGRDWVRSMATIMDQAELLIVDYGYPRREFYHPQRVMGTLVCYSRHRCHDDPFVNIGLQDITAHVDFTAIAEAGSDAGLDVLGFTTQSSFLLDNGLLELVTTEDIVATPRLSRDLQTLLMPGAMGETFKVMALGRGIEQVAPGFGMHDERYRL